MNICCSGSFRRFKFVASRFTSIAKFPSTTAALRLGRPSLRMRSCNREANVCLGIPGKILESYESQGLRMAKVQFGGIVREACLQYVPEAEVGDYVVVHVGFAISKVNEEEAARTYRLLEEMGQLTELAAPQIDEKSRNGRSP